MAYDGSRYNGWQKQGNTDKTIQGKLEQILFKMTGEEIEVHGSGRTDAGVHARGQVANFHIDWKKLEVQEKRELEKNAGNQAGQGCKREKCGGKKTPDQIMEYISEKDVLLSAGNGTEKRCFSEKLLLWSGRTVGCFCHEGSSRSSYRNP